MKPVPLIVLSLLFVNEGAFAREPTDFHQKTTLPTNARFEIVQSELTARWTFRLDRFTGQVAQLVKTQDDNTTWEEMTVNGLPKVTTPSRPRFQIFTSGLAARHTFLIDTDTGRTWLLVTIMSRLPDGTEYEVILWQQFAP